MKTLFNTIDQISEWSGRCVWFLVFIIMFLLVGEAVARYLFNSPTIWVYPVSAEIGSAYLLIAGAYCLRHAGHVSVDVFYRLFPNRGKALLDIITAVLFYSYVLALFWYGIDFAASSVSMRETLEPPWTGPVWPFKLVLPIAAFTLLLQGTSQLIKNIIILIRGKLEASA